MKKKALIITYHEAINYGAVLQAFALSQTLRNLGFEVEFIKTGHKSNKNLKDKLTGIFKKLFKAFKFFLKNGFNNYKDVEISGKISYVSLFEKITRKIERKKFLSYRNRINQERSLEFIDFREKYLPSTLFYSYEELNSNPPKADLYVCGSDQIWKSNLAYYLDFVQKGSAIKLAYAASAGGVEFDKDKYSELQEAITNLDFISVRDDFTKNQAINIGVEKNIEVVLDPTFLLSKEDYYKIFSGKVPDKKYIASYICQYNNVDELLDYCANKLSFDVEHLGLLPYDLTYMIPSPQIWLETIKNSELVITNSFHAVAFSLKFEKEFLFCGFTGEMSHQNNRVFELLEYLELNNRIVYNTNDVDAYIINKENKIDYIVVGEKLSCIRNKSLNFLEEAIDV